MASQDRYRKLVQSLRDWGYIFMLIVWQHSIMASAIAMKNVGSTRTGSVINPDPEFFEKRNSLMKQDMSSVWNAFRGEFPARFTSDEELAADFMILLRNQLAHSHISTGREFALYLPTPSSRKLVHRLTGAGWIATKPNVSNPEMLILREGDKRWFVQNQAMITNFSENTILRATRAYGIDDAAIC